MIPIDIAFTLIVAHFVGDFLLQSDWMAINKSKRWDVLALHVTIYTACFLYWNWRFMALTWATHFLTDAVTSRWTARLWFLDIQARHTLSDWSDYPLVARDCGTRHWFFVVIGLDQLIHGVTLLLTWQALRG